MEPGASIVIVTYNSESTIEDCIKSVLATLRLQDEVIIIDNASTDRTLPLIKNLIQPNDQIKILPQEENLGFSRGCNLGIANSTKEFIILLNPDTEVFGDWIERLMSHFYLYPSTGAVGPLTNYAIRSQLIITYFPEYYDYIHRVYDLLDTLVQRYSRRSIPAKLLTGFCLMLPRRTLDQIGWLDESIYLGDDDLELAWRLRENGYYLRLALDVFINHVGHVSFQSLGKKEEKSVIQEGSNVLLEKMKSYYHPDKIPHPLDYFGIDWWKPSILEYEPWEKYFAPNHTRKYFNEQIQRIKTLVKKHAFQEAIEMINRLLKIHVNNFMLWYILGSIYLHLHDFKNAEFALKNAWALEFSSQRAEKKLKLLYSKWRRNDFAKIMEI